MGTKLKRAIFLILFLMGLSSKQVLAQEWIYTVTKNDSLWNICASYVKEPLCWIKLGQYNQLPKPNQLTPGHVLRIPYSWLKAMPEPAQVVYSKGELSYIPAVKLAKLPWREITQIPSLENLKKSGIEPQPLPSDNRIYMGDRLISGNGNALIEFTDGTKMMIRPHSDIIFNRLSSKEGASFIDTLLILKQGEAVNSVNPKKQKKSRFSIDTPAGVAAVRGTEFRVSVVAGENDENKPGAATQNVAIMRSEVLQGKVAVIGGSDNKAQNIDAGFGIKMEQGKPAPPPRRLLPAPVWSDMGSAREKLPLTVTWQEIPDAKYYQLDLYDERGLIETIAVESNRHTFTTLADGKYRIIGRAVDKVDLKGIDAERDFALYTPLIAPTLTSAGLKVAASGTEAEISWKGIDDASGYHIEIARDAEFSALLVNQILAEPSFSYSSHQAVYIRVSAAYEGKGESDPSSVLLWQPEPDYSKVIIGVFSVLLVIAIL
ncbi:MAG: FecR domain-containing protein [Pseudomonadales bacterium]|nr:FecR domain-containing protein [Pseudomonadales bacterium]MCP5215226.1 FecR domain-containing protein [Pseudomonadales bacterium]